MQTNSPKNYTSILHWPSEERPREKLITHGAENLTTTELLTVIFGTGSQGKTALDLARELLTGYPDLRKLLSIDYQTFINIAGLGPAKYCQLQAAVELGRRYLQESLKRDGLRITQANDVKDFLMARLRDLEEEVFACLFLDSKNYLIAFEKLFFGTINSTNIHPRIVVKRALYHNASAIIAAHNHPSGSATPSEADRAITQQLKNTLDLVDVRFLDHLIIGNPGMTSFAELGLI